jgi:hypothetical protein
MRTPSTSAEICLAEIFRAEISRIETYTAAGAYKRQTSLSALDIIATRLMPRKHYAENPLATRRASFTTRPRFAVAALTAPHHWFRGERDEEVPPR